MESQERERARAGFTVREYDVMLMYLENSTTYDRGILEGEVARRPRMSQTQCLHAKNIVCMLDPRYRTFGVELHQATARNTH
jgi:hypothetical protein